MESDVSSTGNRTLDTCKSIVDDDLMLTSILPAFASILSCLLCLVGIPGNIFTIWFFRKEKNKNSTMFLLMILGFFDALTLLGLLPRSLINIWVLSIDRTSGFQILIKEEIFHSNVAVVPMYTTNFIILLISVERLLNVAKPHTVSLQRKGMLVVCLGVVIICLVCFCVFISKEKTITLYTPKCAHAFTRRELTHFGRNFVNLFKIFHISFFVLTFAIPFGMVGITNIMTIVLLVIRHRQKATRCSRNQNLEVKSTRIVLLVTIFFIVSIAPIGFLEPLSRIQSMVVMDDYSLSIQVLSTFIECLIFSANGFIYCIGSDSYRETFQKCLGRYLPNRCRRRNRVEDSTTENHDVRKVSEMVSRDPRF